MTVVILSLDMNLRILTKIKELYQQEQQRLKVVNTENIKHIITEVITSIDTIRIKPYTPGNN